MEKKKYVYFNRDLSWLRFNHRVLQEMQDERNPLMERLKFAAIFSSNLEEFFEVRVSSIRRIKELDKSLRKKLITKPNRLLKTIKDDINELEAQFTQSLFEGLLPQLSAHGYKLLTSADFDDSIVEFCKTYYEEKVKGTLEYVSHLVSEEDRLFIKSGEKYLIGKVENQLMFYKLPEDHPRFLEVETDKFIFLDDLIRVNIEKEHSTTFYGLKASRDAELYIEDEFSGNLKEKIEHALTNRNTGQFSTVMVDNAMPSEYLDLLYEALDISEVDIIFGGRYHKLKDLFGLQFSDTKDHEMESLEPIRSHPLACYHCILTAMQEKDWLLYFPYESFEEVVRFVEEASSHPDVKIIKATLYRVSKSSAIAKALLEALKNGKKVCVFIETKARFDESNNMYWGEKLSEAGAKVIYSYPGIKVHSKIMYVKAEHPYGVQEYAYVGTGNFNEKTSKIYSDYGLMTAHKKITSEIGRVFQMLERKVIIPQVKNLLISPFKTRTGLEDLIQNEIDYAKDGKEAYIMFKMNSLQDRKMIKSLYKASKAGVKIKLMVRGICCLIPGVPGMSENIEVISIVDRFLEHGRVYLFGNDGQELMYIGSADLMTRNLDHRVEVLAPILDQSIFSKIRRTLMMQFEDNVKTRILDAEQSNAYQGQESNYRLSSQHQIYHMLDGKNNLAKTKST